MRKVLSSILLALSLLIAVCLLVAGKQPTSRYHDRLMETDAIRQFLADKTCTDGLLKELVFDGEPLPA